jgi:hypothetical protein
MLLIIKDLKNYLESVDKLSEGGEFRNSSRYLKYNLITT